MRERWIVSVVLLFLVDLIGAPAPAQWNPAWVHGPNVGQHTSLELDRVGRPHISYYAQNNSNLLYCYHDGLIWDFDTVDAPGNVGKYTSLELDSLDNPHISYFKGLLIGQLRYAVKVGGIWNISVVDTNNVAEDNTSLVLDPITNLPHISYRGGSNNLKHAWFNGTSWQIETVDPNPWTGIESSLSLDPSGNPCISYRNGMGILKYAYFNGAIWQFEDVDNQPMYTSLAIHSNGVAHIAYSQVTSPTTRILRHAWKPAATWLKETIPYSTSNYGSFPSISLDPSGNPRLSFYNDFGLNLLYASKNGSWSIDTADMGNVGQYNSLALESGWLPCISYFDAGFDYLKLSCLRLLDVGVEGILSPPDTVVSGTNYPVRATVKNFGDADVENSFNVNCLITPGPWGGNYSVPDTFYAGEVDTALFGIWQAGAASFYIICVETQLTDSIPANDQMCETLYVARSDASVDTILSPPDVVNMGAIYPVEAFVENFGNVRQTIEVRCWDMGIYNEIETCTLDQGMSTTLSFNNWTAPGIPISWWMSCSTRVSGDVDVTNDKFTKNIIVTGIEESPGEPSTPKFFSLSQNSPNPVTHSTTISYAIPGIRGSGDQAISGGGKLPVQLSIYDITGCLVKTLVDGEQEPGYYSVIWDGRREDGREVSSGIYFYRLQISQGDFTATRKLILLR